MAVHLTLRKPEFVGAGLALTVFLTAVLAMTVTDKFLFASRDAANNSAVTVSQHNREYHPDTLTIPRETVVRIVNNDRFTHHVYVKSPTMNFDSGEEPIGASVNLEFDHSGTFQVLCAIHPTMHLLVTVK